jgi:hopanoid-associated phosphorylase
MTGVVVHSRTATAPVGVIAALREEHRLLARAERLWRHGRPEIILSGMGASSSALAAEALAARQVAGLVSFGYAGGISDKLEPGTLLIAETVDTEDGSRFRADHGWLKALETVLGRAVPTARGALLSVDRILATDADKRRAHAATGALAADMETAAVAKVAARRELPFVALRVVVDAIGQSVPTSILASVDAEGRVALSRLVLALLGRPHDLKSVVGLARAARAADRTLSAVCRLAGPRFGLP